MISRRLSAAFTGPRIYYLLAVLPPLFWSVNFLIARVMRDAIPPIQMSFWRWVLAFLVLAPFALPHGRARGEQIRKELPFLCVLAVVGITAFNCFLYAALHYTTVVNASLINTVMPVMTFIFALALLRDRLRSVQVVGVAVALAGAVLIIAKGSLVALMDLALNRGDMLVVVGVTFWAVYTVLIRWRPTKLPLTVFLAAIIGLGALFHLPLVAWEFSAVGGFSVTPAVAGAFLYFATFPSVLAYIIWNRSVAAIGPGRTGMYMYLMPFFGAVLGVWLLGEDFLLYHLAGIALIFAGITLVNRAPRRG
ncbi:MAG: DMT family transporter [Alphaproteobacteria bacterium]|nr:DMT family transporter [Alphaproteobacteria bacterium]